MKAEEIMKKLSVIGRPEIVYSTATNKFFMNVPHLELKQGKFLSGISEHRETIDDAADGYFERLQGEIIVMRAMSDDRKEYILHNDEFCELKPCIGTTAPA